MNDSVVAAASFIEAPRNPHLVALHEYWLGKRDGRALPSRSDIDPAEIKPLLPHVMLYDADPASDFRIRLVGQSIVEFVGHNFTRRGATEGMPPVAAQNMRRLLGLVAAQARPIFRAGKAYWWHDRSYRDFEACFLPLAPTGGAVNIILGGVTFDTGPAGA